MANKIMEKIELLKKSLRNSWKMFSQTWKQQGEKMEGFSEELEEEKELVETGIETPFDRKAFEETLFSEECAAVNLPLSCWATILVALGINCDLTATLAMSGELGEVIEAEEPEEVDAALFSPFITRALLVEEMAKKNHVYPEAVEELGLDRVLQMMQECHQMAMEEDCPSC